MTDHSDQIFMITGGKISISTENICVTGPLGGCDHLDPGSYIALKVSDTGTGISTKDIDGIFSE